MRGHLLLLKIAYRQTSNGRDREAVIDANGAGFTWWRQSSQFGQICVKGQAAPHPQPLSRGERVAEGRVRGQLPTEPHFLAV